MVHPNKKVTLEKIAFDAPKDLVEAVRNARKESRRYKGELISNRIVYEVGARAFLGIGKESRELIRQKIEDIESQENILKSEKQLWLDQLEVFEAEEKLLEAEVLKNQQDIETLSLKIVEYWEKITVFKKKECIGFIVNSFPERLTREEVASVFPKIPAPVPSHEDALHIAERLLNGGILNE